MDKAFTTLLELYKSYSGSSVFMLLFLMSLCCLWFIEEDKSVKTVLIYIVLATYSIFFIPVFAYLAMEHFLDYEVYYRMLWLLPMGLIVAYCGVTLVVQRKSKIQKGIISILIFFIMMESGTAVITKANFQKADNPYHIPQVAVDLVEAIVVEGIRMKVAFPAELVEFPRQISSQIRMPYGREILIARWNFTHPLYEAIQRNPLVASELAWESSQSDNSVIVIHNTKEMTGTLEEHDYVKIATVEQYDAYMVGWFYRMLQEQGYELE